MYLLVGASYKLGVCSSNTVLKQTPNFGVAQFWSTVQQLVRLLTSTAFIVPPAASQGAALQIDLWYDRSAGNWLGVP